MGSEGCGRLANREHDVDREPKLRYLAKPLHRTYHGPKSSWGIRKAGNNVLKFLTQVPYHSARLLGIAADGAWASHCFRYKPRSVTEPSIVGSLPMYRSQRRENGRAECSFTFPAAQVL
jgi:hypothetical protein